MYENREKYPCEYSEEPPYEVISTPFISQDELGALHTAEAELDRLYNSGRFRRTLEYALSVGDITPYELFYKLGVYLSEKGYKGSIPLDKYTNLVFDFLSELDGVDRMTLRNKMLCDRIATNNSGVIPEKLKVADTELRRVVRLINLEQPAAKGANRTVAILYGEDKAVYCDYENKSRITGEYELRFFELKKERG